MIENEELAEENESHCGKYELITGPFRFILKVFFRKVGTVGSTLLPKGPVIIVAGPHANFLVDALMVLETCGRRIEFLGAATTVSRGIVGVAARAINTIPVRRPIDEAVLGEGLIHSTGTVLYGHKTKFTSELQVGTIISLVSEWPPQSAEIVEIICDTECTLKVAFEKDVLYNKKLAFKILPRLDNSAMYSQTYARLALGKTLCIFPEGFSHERPHLLPVKAGIAQIVLGAMSENPNLEVKIVPCGLNYFNVSSFRSRAYAEYGEAITVSRELVDLYKEGGQSKKDAMAEVMRRVEVGLHATTLNADSHDTLKMFQMARRLFELKPSQRRFTAAHLLKETREFERIYSKLVHLESAKNLTQDILKYCNVLSLCGLRDDEVSSFQLISSVDVLCKFTKAYVGFLILVIIVLPVIVLNLPAIIITWLIGRVVRVNGRDVVATWKMLAGAVMFPIFWIVYWIIITSVILAWKPELHLLVRILVPVLSAPFLPLISWAAMRFFELGVNLIRHAWILCWIPHNTSNELPLLRAELVRRLHDLVESDDIQTTNKTGSVVVQLPHHFSFPLSP